MGTEYLICLKSEDKWGEIELMQCELGKHINFGPLCHYFYNMLARIDNEVSRKMILDLEKLEEEWEKLEEEFKKGREDINCRIIDLHFIADIYDYISDKIYFEDDYGNILDFRKHLEKESLLEASKFFAGPGFRLDSEN